jgi:Mrp family chromosome partitioning ATPase/uncharacterized protein involved in exopolysaccharide biosynthesis
MSLGDILYVVFRHKWKIALISAAGIAGAVALYFFWPLPYQSEARLFVKYIVDTKAPAQGAANEPDKIKVPSERGGETVVNNEVEILTSLDLAQQVAATLPPDLLAKLGGKTNLTRATMAIQQGLLPEVAKKTDVIHVVFKHGDAGVVQPVLKQLIDTYLNRQAEIHRAVGLYDEYLTRQRDELRSRLSATREDLRKAKEKAGILSLEDTKKTYADQMAKIQGAILEADAQLAERQAEVNAMAKAFPTNSESAATLAGVSTGSAATNSAAATNAPAPVPSEKLAEYKRVCGLLESLGRREQELRLQFTPENRLVKGVAEQIGEAEKRKKKLEDEIPALAAVKVEEPRGIALPPAAALNLGPRMELIADAAKVPGLESKIMVLTNQLDRIRKEFGSLTAAEGAITELELSKQVQQAQYDYFQKALDELRADEQLGAGRSSNIIPIQTASPALRDASKLMKVIALLLFGSIGAAFALAFVIELYLDPSLKRPIEVEARLGLPLYISIPRMGLNGKSRLLGIARKVPLLPQNASGAGVPPAAQTGNGNNGAPPDVASAPSASSPPSVGLEENGSQTSPLASANSPPSRPGSLVASSSTEIAPWDPRHKMRPFYEALRDRLITFFEVKNLTHKPKLVALTSCLEGAGVTTIAAGLAASLSETGDGNVLLVEMNQQGAAHQFYQGDLACGLDDALEADKRGGALVQDNLYVATEATGNDRLPQALPKRFKHLVPRLKASDYDYIIFDMPPISQISMTPRLARFMDMVLMVVESEKTDRQVVKRASSMLAESGANVGVVLNKGRTYVPRRLLQEL